MDPEELKPEKQEKIVKAWQTPELTIYGSVDSITQGGRATTRPGDVTSGTDVGRG